MSFFGMSLAMRYVCCSYCWHCVQVYEETLYDIRPVSWRMEPKLNAVLYTRLAWF